ncbi:MAG: hypothetical protein WA364_10020 [Candidatus Nitrosopolaris sp.]
MTSVRHFLETDSISEFKWTRLNSMINEIHEEMTLDRKSIDDDESVPRCSEIKLPKTVGDILKEISKK